MESNGRQQGQKPAAKVDWEKRIADRAELAKRAGAHVLIPTSGVTRIVLQITQQLDALYQQLTQQSGYFGKVSNEKRMELEQQLAEHLIGMSLTAEKMAKTVGGRARYYHPRELERFLKTQTQAARPAKKAVPAERKAAAAAVAPVAAVAEEAAPSAQTAARIAKKVAAAVTPLPVAAVEVPAAAVEVPAAATA